jgi:uncharacterized protein YqkB
MTNLEPGRIFNSILPLYTPLLTIKSDNYVFEVQLTGSTERCATNLAGLIRLLLMACEKTPEDIVTNCLILLNLGN